MIPEQKARGADRSAPDRFEADLREDLGTYSGCRECGDLRKSCPGYDPLTMKAKGRTGRPRCFVYEIDATKEKT